MKIVVLDGYTLNPGDIDWRGLSEIGTLNVYERTSHGTDAVVKAIGDAEIVFTNKTPLSEETLLRVPAVRYIGVLATGYNIVDVAAAARLGITVTNVPAYSTDSVAQLTFALLLEICHHAGAHSESVKKGEWSNSIDFCYWKYDLIELAGKTIGIVGFGRIGQAVARIAVAFGMKVMANDTVSADRNETGNVRLASFDEILKEADIITLHCPLTESTKGIINSGTIARMKDGVIIINTARGPLVVEKDLAEALEHGKVYGAAVDVVSVEPIERHNPLLTAPRCIITPHIAWAPREARIRLMNTAVANLKAFLRGSPVNVVSR